MNDSLNIIALYYRTYQARLIGNLFLVVVRVGCVTMIPWLTRQLFDFDPEKPWVYAGWLVAILVSIIGMVACSYETIRVGKEIGASMETDLRRDLFRHLQKLSFSYYDRTKTGHLMARMSNDLSTLSGTLHQLPEDVLSSVLSLGGALVVMFWMNWPLALIAMLPLPIAVWQGIRSKEKFKKHSHQIRQEIGTINSAVENSVMGIREVQSFTNEETQMASFEKTNQRFCEAKYALAKTTASFASFMIGFMRAHSVLVAVAGSLMCVFGSLDIADLIAFIMYTRFMMFPIERLVSFSDQYAQGMAALERFTDVLCVEPDIQDKPGAKSLDAMTGTIRFDGVSFAYDETSGSVLDQVDLTVKSGSTVALVGESGAGKSTLASLIPRFYEATSGAVLLDETPIADLPLQWLRERIGIVRQSPFLFDSTIRENIAFGRPGAAEEEIIDAARQANILEFIESLPDRFDTLVGEQGVLLSGGQRQRVSIARVFLKNPPILIFDEATSSLDNESERYVRDAMDKLFEGRTTLIIAHRLSTVKHADLTVALRNGQVVESGSHEELLAKKGYYHQLYTQGLA